MSSDFRVPLAVTDNELQIVGQTGYTTTNLNFERIKIADRTFLTTPSGANREGKWRETHCEKVDLIDPVVYS